MENMARRSSLMSVILLDLPASAIMEAGPQDISRFAGTGIIHILPLVPNDHVQLLLPPLLAASLLLPQPSLATSFGDA